MLALVCAAALAAPGDADLLSPLGDKDRDVAKKIIASFTQNPRGPYSGISWFCNDGTEQLPRLNGCAEHGGGKMYGVFGPDAKKLERLGVYVGTVLAAMPQDELDDRDFYRGRALAVEKYLERALDGWALHSAKTYRGFRQDEDEADSAREILMVLAGQKSFIGPERALLIRLSRSLPYGRGSESLAVDIRALAATIGDAEKTFAPLRFKIHAAPEPSDIQAVEAWAAGRTDDFGKQAQDLAARMRTYYDPTTRLQRLKDVKTWVQDKATKQAIQTFLDTNPHDVEALLDNGLALMAAADKAVRPGSALPERNLLLLHTIGLVEELWIAVTAELGKRKTSRTLAIHTLERLLDAAHHAGLLSSAELASTAYDVATLRQADAQSYPAAVRRLQRVLEWGRARLTASLAVPLARYGEVEPQAAQVVDDILRSGVMLPLAAVLDRLAADSERLRGGGHRLIGVQASTASLRGENPGLAVGVLRGPGTDLSKLQRTDIALLQDLPPELPPVAGVITLGAPGSLSHVALLARNLGIPLAAVGGDVAQALMKLQGQEVVVAVSQGRRVAIGPFASLAPADQQIVRGEEKKKEAAPMSLTIDTARLDLATARILKLSEVAETDAGVRCGPKAAELGRLKRLFPTRVSDAAVIPFGVFLKHVDRPAADGGPSPYARLKDAYARYRVNAPANAEAAANELLLAMDKFRADIMSVPFAPGFEAEVLAALRALGDPGSFGVFVRSDTNVEDLKDFTGAGLNLTVPNRVRVRDVTEAIREVWASPYTERSFRWRQRLLTNPEAVFPSVLLHRTVPSEMSGVLVTTDLETGNGDATTVSASEGVAGVVDGGSPETVVLLPDGTTRLLASSRTPSRKVIPKPPRQGVDVTFAQGKDPLLTDKDLEELRGLATEVRQKVPPKAAGVPWDVEWGIVRNKAFLMQMRPLKLSRAAAVHPYLTALDAQAPAQTGALDLNQDVP